GGFGKVNRAVHLSNNQHLALKCILKKSSHRTDFHREIDALYRLNFGDRGHLHCCKLFGFLESEHEYWVGIELIEGGESFEHLMQKGAYSEATLASFLCQFAEMLSFFMKMVSVMLPSNQKISCYLHGLMKKLSCDLSNSDILSY
ncbi:hypothetical protein ACHAWX_002650, partial [Stephanocyclus meneghinianus]